MNYFKNDLKISITYADLKNILNEMISYIAGSKTDLISEGIPLDKMVNFVDHVIDYMRNFDESILKTDWCKLFQRLIRLIILYDIFDYKTPADEVFSPRPRIKPTNIILNISKKINRDELLTILLKELSDNLLKHDEPLHFVMFNVTKLISFIKIIFTDKERQSKIEYTYQNIGPVIELLNVNNWILEHVLKGGILPDNIIHKYLIYSIIAKKIKLYDKIVNLLIHELTARDNFYIYQTLKNISNESDITPIFHFDYFDCLHNRYERWFFVRKKSNNFIDEIMPITDLNLLVSFHIDNFKMKLFDQNISGLLVRFINFHTLKLSPGNLNLLRLSNHYNDEIGDIIIDVIKIILTPFPKIKDKSIIYCFEILMECLYGDPCLLNYFDHTHVDSDKKIINMTFNQDMRKIFGCEKMVIPQNMSKCGEMLSTNIMIIEKLIEFRHSITWFDIFFNIIKVSDIINSENFKISWLNKMIIDNDMHFVFKYFQNV
jgi:hypothetical protein